MWNIALIATFCESFMWLAHFVLKWPTYSTMPSEPFCPNNFDKNRCKLFQMRVIDLTLKEPGAESAPPSTFFVISLPVGFFFCAETSWLFSFKPCARFKTIFIKIGPRVMTRRCVIARWVQRKTDFPLKLHTNHVLCLFCLSGYTSTMFYLIYLVYLE